MKKVEQAVAAINADGKQKVHARLLHVVDDRDQQPPGARLMAPASPAGRTFWVDRTDKEAMRDLLSVCTGASVSLPVRETVLEQPGSRWYRPWSPHLIMTNIGRSHRYGFDGRFDVHGMLVCRMNGYTLSSINTTIDGKTPHGVTGAGLFGHAELVAREGIPLVARGILEEAMLLDPSNADDIARAWLSRFRQRFPKATAPKPAEVEKLFRQQIIGNLMLRDPELPHDERMTIYDAQSYHGEMPSEVAYMPWQPRSWEPLFANISYTYDPAAPGPLGPVDMSLGSSQGAPIQGTERRLLGASVARILDSAIVSKMVLGPDGHPIPANKPDAAGLGSDDFLRLDVLSAALPGVDELLFNKGVRMRAGSLRITSVQVVGELGTAETVKPPASSSWQTQLLPRLTSWSRVQLRLWSASSDDEADQTKPPVVGFLVPDLLEHTLEVYDHEGRALGQLASDPPAKTAIPAVRFEPHPWHAAPIENPLLAAVVDGLVNAAKTEQSPKAGMLHESALTAMMRVIDTVRSTVDLTDKHGDRKVRMLGSPIAIVRARLKLERAGLALPAGDPPLLTDPLTLTAKVGTATQPDDGVLGCFIPATQPGGGDAHFRPVDAAALKNTIINALANADAKNIKTADACHTFVHDPAGADTTFTLGTGQERELLLFLDINGGIYVTSGVLPRKRIALPSELLAAALRKLEPSFRVGPVLAAPSGEIANAILPVPAIPGYTSEWIEHGHTEGSPIPPLPADGLLPERRVSLVGGWLNLVPPE
jgi:hypothetical protein